MKNLAYLIFGCVMTSIFYGCQNPMPTNRKSDEALDTEHTKTVDIDSANIPACRVKRDTIKADIEKVDSLIVVALCDNSGDKILFKIAQGGNVECIADTIEIIGDVCIARFTLADYSQEDQIFYLLYNIVDENFIQSERINLALFGKTIMDYASLKINHISPDSIYITSIGGTCAVGLQSIDCDTNKIINYYEYQ